MQNLQRTLNLVQQQQDLQTSSLLEQVDTIDVIVRELTASLAKLGMRISKSSIKRHFHALICGPQEAKELATIMRRLDSAHDQLSTRIQIVHVGLTRQFSDQWDATLPIIHRMDENFQTVLGLRMDPVQSMHISQSDDGNLLYADQISTYDSTPAYMGNVSFDHAWQVNGNLEAVDWETMACVQYKNNQAHGHSLQINGAIGLESLQAILQSRP